MARVWKELSGYERDSKYASVCESHFNPKDPSVSKYEAKALLQRKKKLNPGNRQMNSRVTIFRNE